MDGANRRGRLSYPPHRASHRAGGLSVDVQMFVDVFDRDNLGRLARLVTVANYRSEMLRNLAARLPASGIIAMVSACLARMIRAIPASCVATI